MPDEYPNIGTGQWFCAYCHHELAKGEQCPMPACVEAREKARIRMGMDEPRAEDDK